MPVSRETLYEEVWLRPMTKVAASYQVSSSFLARVCQRLNVPRPARGYWAKLQFGKAPERPGLPEARLDHELEWSRDGEVRSQARRSSLPRPPRKARQAIVSPVRKNPDVHELIEGVRELFEAGRKSDNGYLRPWKKLVPDLFVSTGTLERALNLANQLYRGLEERGHRVALAPRDGHYGRPELDERTKVSGRHDWERRTWTPARPTLTFIKSVAFGLTIYEPSESVEQQYIKGKYIPVSELTESDLRAMRRSHTWTHTSDLPRGRLCIRVTSPYGRVAWERFWRESTAGELSDLVPRIIRTLEREAAPLGRLVEEARKQAEEEHRRWLEELARREREEAERRRLQAIEEEARRKAKNLKDGREQLFEIIEAWSTARATEAFFQDVEERISSLGEAEREDLRNRLGRARDLLGGVDGLKRFREWKTPEER